MKTIPMFILSLMLLSLWAAEGSAKTKLKGYNDFGLLTTGAFNQPPLAVNDQITVMEDTPGTGNALTNDTDADGDPLIASLVVAPVHGNMVFNADGSFTYTPSPNYTGTDSFVYQVCDNGAPSLCNTATVTITITGINDAPTITGLPSNIIVTEDATEDPFDISSATISDPDAGSGALTLTLNATGGVFDIAAGTGITVTGHLTNHLTLTGNLTDLNNYINIPSNIYFRPNHDLSGPNAAVAEVSINDNGNTGSGGGNNVIIGTVNINITPVNDAPVNSVPIAQVVGQDVDLVFSAGNSNPISIGDVDAASGSVSVTLTASNGLLTLAGTTGLVFSVGDGTADGTMTFNGTISNINTALGGLTFRPTSGYTGAASIQITTSDLGLTGSGGTQTDNDIINIAVNVLNPEIVTVNTSTPDGIYNLNDEINITLTFNQVVMVDITGGLPKLLLETGSTDRQATYFSGSGSNTLRFNYTVQGADLSADLDYTSAFALSLNGGTIRNALGDNAILTLPAPGSANSIAGQHNIVIDGVKPLVTSVVVPANGIYNAGNMLQLSVNFNENVNVDATGGKPHVNIVIGATTYQAIYTGGSGTTALTFRYTIQPGDMDMNGILVGALILNGGTVKDVAGNDALLALNNIASTSGVLVNTASPTVVVSTSATSPINQAFTASIAFSEAVTGFLRGDIAATNATLSNLQTADNITYTVLITPIADGLISIQVPAGVAVNIGNNNNTASNTLNLTFDASGPVITSVNVPANGVYKSGDQLNFTVNYNENVILNTLAGSPSLSLTLDGVNRSAIYVGGTGSNSLTFRYTIVTGDLDQNGIALGASLGLNAATIRDAGGNNANSALNSVGSTTNVRVDAVAPAIPASFAATAGNAENSLTWLANTESDLDSYKIYAGTANNPTTLLTTIPAPGITFLHNTLINGTTYYYRISAVDQVGNESPLSPSIFAKPMASQVITFDQPSAKTYGQEAFDLVGSSDSGLALTYTSSDPTIASISGKTVNILKAGSVQIIATQLGNEAVKPAIAVTRSLDIHKTTLTITAENKEKFAGTANPSLTLKYVGFVFNETPELLDKAPSVSTFAITSSPAGDYPILVSGAVASNYEFTYVNGILKVKPGAPTDITMESTIVYENGPAKTKAGAFSSVSGDPSATYTYSFVAGIGDTDNALFSIEDNSLFTKNTLDFERKSMYNIRIKTTTQYGLSLEKAFTITITDVNEAPTLASISNSTICYTRALQTILLTGISAGPEKNQAVTLSVNSDNPTLFQNLKMSGSENNTSLSYSIKEGRTGTANITVTVTDDGGTANGGINTYSKTFVLTVNPLPVIAITSNKGSDISKGDIVVLTASGAMSYVWIADNSIISGQNTATLTVRPTENITYTVTGTNATGCPVTESFSIKVAEDLKLIANNIVTPNGDGYNDKWIVENIDVYPDNLIKIFDRAGRMLYSKKGYDNSWDATYNGSPLNEDTYYYVIEFTGSIKKFKGYITVVRNN